MKRFVGDLSRSDACILERWASGSQTVLEFGAGGSTQIIAQSIPDGGRVVSVETAPEWVGLTRRRLERFQVAERCEFLDWRTWQRDPAPSEVDLVFVDGADELRRLFAILAWPLLRSGGVMLFHDTRRAADQANVLALVSERYNEIASVALNAQFEGVSSNLTLIVKKPCENYVNWNDVEGRSHWQIGWGEPPESFWETEV